MFRPGDHESITIWLTIQGHCIGVILLHTAVPSPMGLRLCVCVFLHFLLTRHLETRLRTGDREGSQRERKGR